MKNKRNWNRKAAILAAAVLTSTCFFAGNIPAYADGTTIPANVSGGSLNIASGKNSSVTGGSENTASGKTSTVTGGMKNNASGEYSTIHGGTHNTTLGDSQSILGGYYNVTGGYWQFDSEGAPDPDKSKLITVNDDFTKLLGHLSTVSGGELNAAYGDWSSISGGGRNVASGPASSVSAGFENTSAGQYSSVSGGYRNTASGTESSIIGGSQNIAFGYESSIMAGENNITIESNSYAVGGSNSVVQGRGSTGLAGGSTGSDAKNAVAIGSGAVTTVENGTAIGNESVATKANTISFGHKKGDISGYTVTWKQRTDTDSSGNIIKNADWTTNDYTQSPTITATTYTSDSYNRLVNVADGEDDHDVATVGQLNKKLYTEVRPTMDGNYVHTASTAGENLMALDTQVKDNADHITTINTTLSELGTSYSKTDLSNLNDTGKATIRDLSKSAVKVVNGKNTKVTTGESGDATTYAVDVDTDAVANTVRADMKTDLDNKANINASNIDAGVWATKLGTGTIASGNTGLVTGGTVYTEVRPASGTYVNSTSTTAANLTSLDTQVSKNTNTLESHTKSIEQNTNSISNLNTNITQLQDSDNLNVKYTDAHKTQVDLGAANLTTTGSGSFSSVIVSGNTYISSTGINANNKVISGVLAGSADTDAVNVKQMNDAIANISSTGFSGNMNGKKITNLANGTDATDAVNKGQMDTADKATLTSAQSYTDTAKADAIKQANGYTDTAKADAIKQANGYTDT
ncbi:Head domain of trimeric autotransporter adhesin, partial [Megasphaera elsdenii]